MQDKIRIYISFDDETLGLISTEFTSSFNKRYGQRIMI